MEPIKQEIINNIFENGDKLITGPILQTVLIDMIDDVNVKDQEILSKTGSWDEAVTQIPNLATKEEVTNLSESVARDLENVVGGDLTGYATEQWVQSQGYLKEHQDISGLATKTELTAAENNLQGNITSLSESVARDLASVPEGVATEAWVQSQDYANKSYVDSAVSSSSVDLTGYATETWVQNQGYLKEHQDISNLATKTELTSVSESIQTDISGLATKTELNSVSQSVQTDITNLSESVANSAVWKKGEGQDSVVQKLTGANEAKTPTATGADSIATGYATKASGAHSHAEGFFATALEASSHAEGSSTKASGNVSHAEGDSTKAEGYASHAEGDTSIASGRASHAEGNHTKASGTNSHAEGFWTEAPGHDSHAEGGNTEASGQYSHAEGWYAFATNDYEHAQGQYNHNSSNQIFSVGAGENVSGTVTRRNAVSILAVPNAETQINTASFFVQNVGGYDGTNPEPGTNDLATVINNLPSGGGSSETLWKKGTGTDSIVQILTGNNEANTSRATGTGSIATGYYSQATGPNSHAEGGWTQASGKTSHAEGDSTKAEGESSHAEGYATNTSGYWSHAEGNATEASGIGSHAEGDNTGASGWYSHAEGYYTSASNNYEHAQGRYNHNSTNQIFSIGTGNSDTSRRNAVSVLEVDNSGSYTSSFFVQNIGGYDGTNPEPGTNDLATVINGMSTGGGSSETLWKKGTGTDSIVQVIASGEGQPTATGERAVATGYRTTASGLYSYAEGLNAEASGDYSHAEGLDTNAIGDASHAEGRLTMAFGEDSHAEGYGSHAEGYYSHAEGENTNATGNYSHAEGASTRASGSYSHAEGFSTTASNDYEHAQGRYNHSSTNQIFSVGAGEYANGTATRRNALSVLAVPNADTKITTSSFFVQNVGGYDGTNPLPGTNDLATVLNNTETWTFTLEDGSTVTKTIRIA